ncbi:MAG: AsmA family protein, partial [Acidobacteriota bacterium]|nr:AsmA family protein [Acidobacteriota bacterium]
MPSSSRAVRLLAGLFIVLLAIPVALSTPWVKAWLFERATSWARGRYGVEIRAARFDYRLASLALRVDDLTVAHPETPDRPFIRIAQLDVDLAASALRGRLDFDAIRVQNPSLTFDSTTRSVPSAAAPAPPGAGGTTLPSFSVGALDVQDLDLIYGDVGSTRVVVRRLSTSFRGRGPSGLEGELAVAGGVAVSFGTEAMQTAFDRVDGRIVLDEGALTVGSMTASSPFGQVRAEGTVPLDGLGSLDLRYDAIADLERFGEMWRDLPAWTGRASARGAVRGTLQYPDASFEVVSTDL